MIIYCNQEIPHNIEDVCHEIQYDEYVYSANGIYKKYKYHFYEINTESEEKACLFKNKEFVLQEKEARLDKNKIITCIPFQHYYVQRKSIKTQISEHISWVKEIDNDTFTRDYFCTSIPFMEALDTISLFLDNKLS